MEKVVNPVSPSVVTEKKEFNFCSDELILDYSIMDFPMQESGNSQTQAQLQPILNYYW